LENLARNPEWPRHYCNYSGGYERFGYNSENPAHRDEFHRELGKCSKYTHKNYGFMISVLIVKQDDTNLPGEGFFTLDRELDENVGITESEKIGFLH
jgi:hypothetical protein